MKIVITLKPDQQPVPVMSEWMDCMPIVFVCMEQKQITMVKPGTSFEASSIESQGRTKDWKFEKSGSIGASVTIRSEDFPSKFNVEFINE